ncbi:efflux RND transporter periplasmic adaptor subunit [Marinobacterium mangrovicola]|uniref:Cu(I)/Ag(I) efflux system membrane fusion protein n=1 Tax=Marinobacterium mangrovicola TaxID=1476959 RepID=A0A4R1GX11_9GAMM|nr:efflux RND transporter periplasmic adaptor subunit [Marinobacterium mangrovicola]TCK08972.1 Cu(I)/Ag(I) efflux system membrane fusion protein [Marinobacterium mangrovicola]
MSNGANNGKGAIKSLALLVAGIAVGAGAVYLTQPGGGETGASASGEPEPLYWVAPMDPNYRRDQPGKSPMGMDLIPVYAEDQNSGPDEGAGTISIAPEVVNNLGVRTGEVAESSLNFEVRTVGYIQYSEDRIVHIHPRVEGWIEKLYVKAAGEPVKQGQPLYDLYSPELVNAQEELLFALSRGDSRLTNAAEARLRSLNVSDSVIGTLKRNRRTLQTVTFYAPADGVIDDFAVREGFYVKPGMTLMSVGALDEVWVEAEVFERQSNLIKQGLPVVMRLDYLPGREWDGEVDYVYPTLDPNTRTLRVRLRFANPDRELKPNMFAEVRILNQSSEPVLSVPREAVIRSGQQNRVVLALGEGRFKSVAVNTGRSDGSRIEILDGLSAGEQVVTSAQFLLDSESSKTSDFKRMHQPDESDTAEQPAEVPTSVWADAQINKLMPDDLKINVDHAAIPEWNWPEMKMDFSVSEWVDLSTLNPGDKAQIEIRKLEEGGYQVNDIYVTEPAAGAQGGEMSGSSSDDMSGMDHSSMDHSAMESGADQGADQTMDHSNHNANPAGQQ